MRWCVWWLCGVCGGVWWCVCGACGVCSSGSRQKKATGDSSSPVAEAATASEAPTSPQPCLSLSRQEWQHRTTIRQERERHSNTGEPACNQAAVTSFSPTGNTACSQTAVLAPPFLLTHSPQATEHAVSHPRPLSADHVVQQAHTTPPDPTHSPTSLQIM